MKAQIITECHFAMQVDVDIMGSQNSVRQDYIEMQQRAFPWSVNRTDGAQNGAVTLQVCSSLLYV